MIRVAISFVSVAFALMAASSVHAQGSKVSLSVVKYDALKDFVLKNRGKVVVVDFWGDFCIPCKRNMPHLVEMYHKHAGEGLEVATVSIDKVQLDPAVKDRVTNFLRKTNADFTNLLLDESDDVVVNKLRIKAVPSVYIFDRQGKWVHFADGVAPDVVESTVRQMLAEK